MNYELRVRKSLFIAAGVLMASCGAGGTGDIPVLDVTASYPGRNITLQEIATVEYLPLETREGFLIDYPDVHHIDEEIIVSGNQEGDIMIFDRRTGRGLTSFNRQGRGPGEYHGFNYLAVDRAAGEIFVAPNGTGTSVGYPVFVYDMEGKPLRTLEFSTFEYPDFFHNAGSERLVFYDRNISNPHPLNSISGADTVVTPLPVKFPVRDEMASRKEYAAGRFMTIRNGDPIARIPGGYMFSESGIDTMYRYDVASGRLTPVMTRTPSWASMEYPVGVYFLGESSDWTILYTVERRFDWDTNEGFDRKFMLYDKRGGEFFEGMVLNADIDDTSRPFINQPEAGVPGGSFTLGLSAYMILDLHAAGKLSGPLAEIAANLKEDDNPVLTIVTYK